MKMEVGKVLKAQGIKGEVKISCLLDSPTLLKKIKTMYLGVATYNVEKMRCDDKFCYVLFKEVADRNQAELLRNKSVFVNKEDIVLDEGRYFIEDLVGCNVVLDDGMQIGKVEDVLQYGAADVIVCQGEKCEISFPFLKDLPVSIDVAKGEIVLLAKRFAEVAVYNED